MKWCEIFRAGAYKDAKGTELKYTNEDVETIARNFNEGENSSAPIVVGHPKSNSPSYGWGDSLKAKDGKLYASFKQVANEFAEWVNDGRYKTRSISIYPNKMLKHVGFLGGTPPRIKGMPEFVFNEDAEAETYDFSDLSDYKFDTLARIIQRLRDFLIDKYDVQTAENLISIWNIETLKEVESKTPQEISNYCEELLNKGKELDLITNDPKVTKTEDFSEELNSAKELAEKLQKENDELKATSRKAQFEDFAEKAVKAGNITPAQKIAAIDFMEVCHECGTFDFSEGEDKTALTRFQEFLGGMKQIEYSEFPDGEETNTIDFSDPQEISEAIIAYKQKAASEGKIVSESSALKALKKGNQ